MERAIGINSAGEYSGRSLFSADTAFVLFFLALEFGRVFSLNQADWILAALACVTLPVLIFVPYFMPSFDEKPEFKAWVRGRLIVAGMASVFGLAYGRAEGVVFPDLFRFMPMTLLILAAFISGCIQFSSIMKVRLAK